MQKWTKIIINKATLSTKWDEKNKEAASQRFFKNIVCVVAGTGTLGLPYALQQGGWIGLLILGLSWLFSICKNKLSHAKSCPTHLFLCEIDTGIVLIRSLYHNGHTRLSSYQEVAEEAFGAIGGWVAFFFTAVTLIGVPVLYLLLAGQNLHTVCKGTAGELTFPIWVIICAAIVGIPFVFFKSLRDVGILSCFGTIATVVVVLIVLGVCCLARRHRTKSISSTIPSFGICYLLHSVSIAFSFGKHESVERTWHNWVHNTF